ncbi:MAG: ATP-binding protein [Desulfobulbaceae bacterium]|nr:ATP-binding protein [Desulfobulbaceae bacterium]
MDSHKYYAKLLRGMTTAFFILIIVPTLITTLVTTYNFKQNAISRIEISEIRVIEHRKDVIDLFLRQHEDLLATLVRLYPSDYLSQQQNLDSLFTAVNQSGDIVDLHMIDSSGEQLAYVGPYRDKIAGKNYGDASWFKEVLISGKHISDVFTGYRNVPHFVVAVTNPLKTYVLRATINSEMFNSLLLSAQIGPNGDAFIVNSNAEFQTPSLQGVASLSDQERVIFEHGAGIATHRIDSYIYATKWIKDGQWLLVIKSKIDDSLGSYYANRNHNIMLIVISSIIVLFSAVLISRYLVRKVQQYDRERAQLEQQMVQVEKMVTIGRLAAGIAHEINNPLQMITSQAGWIEELLPEEDSAQVKNLEEYKDSIRKIKFHVQRAGKVTHRLLGFSRKMHAEKESVKINDVIEETISFIENEARNNKIVINRKFEANLPVTMTDGPQLQQVFLNLLNNALDAIELDGVIDVTTWSTPTKIYMKFADSGPGIKPEVMKEIFDPFFTTKEPGKGTGLGMSICYDIMQKIGGEIAVGNKDEGGAVVTLVLPIIKLGNAGKSQA